MRLSFPCDVRIEGEPGDLRVIRKVSKPAKKDIGQFKKGDIIITEKIGYYSCLHTALDVATQYSLVNGAEDLDEMLVSAKSIMDYLTKIESLVKDKFKIVRTTR